MNIKITLNGRVADVPAGLNIISLLESQNIPADRVAVELNRQILTRKLWPERILQEGDAVEIVTFVGGGSL